jgi:hypothetical protein
VFHQAGWQNYFNASNRALVLPRHLGTMTSQITLYGDDAAWTRALDPPEFYKFVLLMSRIVDGFFSQGDSDI